MINPSEGRDVNWVTLGHPGLTYILNFWHSGTLALSPERQSARMSEIKNEGYTLMALNTSRSTRCNQLKPLPLKGFNSHYADIVRNSVILPRTSVDIAGFRQIHPVSSPVSVYCVLLMLRMHWSPPSRPPSTVLRVRYWSLRRSCGSCMALASPVQRGTAVMKHETDKNRPQRHWCTAVELLRISIHWAANDARRSIEVVAVVIPDNVKSPRASFSGRRPYIPVWPIPI